MEIDEVRSRAKHVLSQRGLVLLISLLSSVTFSRLVSPEEFGVAAMATLTFCFITVLRDLGLSSGPSSDMRSPMRKSTSCSGLTYSQPHSWPEVRLSSRC